MFRPVLRPLLLLLLLSLPLVATPAPAPAQNPHAQQWYSRDAKGAVALDFYFFWSAKCRHCNAARPEVEAMAHDYPWLRLHSLELTGADAAANIAHYRMLAARFGQPGNAVPAFFFCGMMVVGYDNAAHTGAQLRKHLTACHDRLAAGQPMRESDAAARQMTEVQVPALGKMQLADHSLPVTTLILGAMDAFNPCAFFVLLFLLSLLVHARSRGRMLLVGGVFALFSGLIYFIFMAAWLNLFLMLGPLRWVTAGAGAVAVLIALFNIKDYFWLGRGPSLSIPDGAKPGLFQRMRGLLQARGLPTLLAGTAVLAVAANSYELLCTSGFPMVFTRILSLHNLPGPAYYGYLALYNVIYVIPLLVIVLLFSLTMGQRKLGEGEGRLLKLLSGAMMLGLGLLLLFAPQLLNNVLGAAAVMGGAVVVTLLARGLERRRGTG